MSFLYLSHKCGAKAQMILYITLIPLLTQENLFVEMNNFRKYEKFLKIIPLLYLNILEKSNLHQRIMQISDQNGRGVNEIIMVGGVNICVYYSKTCPKTK